MIPVCVYFGMGAALALVLRARAKRDGAPSTEVWVSSALCLLLWPLWAPIAWTRRDGKADADATEVTLAREALDDAREVVRGTPLEGLLSPEVVARIVAELDQLVLRRDELRRLCRRGSRLASGDRPDAGDARLIELAERDSRRLSELLEVVRALRTRLVLARYGGASLDGVGDLLSELTTHVESLDEALACPAPPPRGSSALAL